MGREMSDSADGSRAPRGPARARLFASIRAGLGASGNEQERREAVARRLAQHAAGLIPGRARQDRTALLALFRSLLEGQSATVTEIASADEIPAEVASYLRRHNLPLRLRMGADPYLEGTPWDKEPALERTSGHAVGSDTAGLSRALAGVAETGTLVLASGGDNPTTLNFLPENHIVVVREGDIVGAYEQVWTRLRQEHGEGLLPRAVNFVSGPSRTADIEQQLVMGAHGPRRMLVLVVKDG
jgi:L-lactate dehydrogenase complex protein LldG